jgi:phosphatidylethanolamine/phosphatidyl-N-methylethanolamine N-methyltransferase
MPAPAPLLDLTRDLTRRFKLEDEARFIRNWVEKPLTTGAVSPSGRALAELMARYVDPALPGPILELGPGTGPVTDRLVRRGIAPERLIMIEYNPDFVPLLKARYPAATVIRGDAYAARTYFDSGAPFAAVVSSLPLLTKPVEQRLDLLRSGLDLLQPGAPFIQFTYMVSSPLPLELLPREIEAEASPVVWKNLPPARVWCYRRP